ncbi:MAG: ABC transporter ATP-binding protein [Treponema sp.]|jgi:branched-chain amino acid transport system ATP-binding protein|nr:ABC transporter ATP-binding protein [Treponema sp.]MBQ1971132.1 ABC transporter ATP-binding protein [Treponema sp.]MBQ5646146.1 ABC transporter ATP-binding protein [Treponema sp.]MBQ5876480.1 ABC transporter ATP-binding protein [Treponema sp.]MEE1058644.1 ABC transporter ATP-binding protein [Treponema sp.]
MLKVENLCVSYGAINALRGISFEVHKGEIITLIGSNGAGKTTTLHAISNIIKKQSGSVVFEGTDITNFSADKIVKQHLIQVPEGRRIFANLSVRENLELGAYLRNDKAGIKRDMEMVYELFPRLKERLKQNAGTLSGGEQQMLAMGRALMEQPSLLLLDEPSMGLAPILVDEIFEIIKKINKTGTTILLVEQNAFKALSIANRAYVLETGSITRSGNAQELISDPAVKEAYLGG